MRLVFELPPELTIYNALETREALLTWVAQQTARGNAALALSARQVVEVDGSGLQLVAALSHTDPPWSLVETSSAFSEACHTLGFGHWIEGRHLSEPRGSHA